LGIGLFFEALCAAIAQFISFLDDDIFGAAQYEDDIFINAIGYFEWAFYEDAAQIGVLVAPNFSCLAIGEGKSQDDESVVGMEAEFVDG
jgi:hypothetical protein